MRSSASKISASSELGRCCVIRPHMASLVSSPRMTDPAGGPADPATDPLANARLDAALGSQGPLDAATAQQLIARGRERIELGDAAHAIADFRRVIGQEDPAITAAALLGYGDAL